MTDEQPIKLAYVPEPSFTPAELAALSAHMRDPAFWDALERLPEPPDETAE